MYRTGERPVAEWRCALTTGRRRRPALGLQYRILSPAGGKLTNGKPVPAAHDGMAAFAGDGGATVLVRNHELQA